MKEGEKKGGREGGGREGGRREGGGREEGGREEGREGGITVHHTHTSLLVKCPFFLPVSMGDL